MKKLLIVVPTYNEEKNLPQVLNELLLLQNPLSEWQIQSKVLIVDDGSKDRSAEIAKQAGVDVLQLPINLGYGAALQSGFIYALENKVDLVISIDADGQHQPSDILKIVEAYLDGKYDVVLGSRFVEDTGYQTNLPRRLGIKMFSVILHLLSGLRIADVTTGFQLITRQVVELYAAEYPHDYPDAQMLLLLALSGFKIKEIPVVVKQRLHGQSMHSSIKSLLYPIRNFLAIIVILLRIPQVKKTIQLK
ncbi:glycosyltransferase family 2 protein [candidate division KSB1 bacterium]|nr:glycosyltransferase family 2 protein [candidate division KSB1 bacterium]